MMRWMTMPVRNTDDAKAEIRQVLHRIIDGDSRYWHQDTYIRWGVVERDLLTIVEHLEIDDDRSTVGDV